MTPNHKFWSFGAMIGMALTMLLGLNQKCKKCHVLMAMVSLVFTTMSIVSGHQIVMEREAGDFDDDFDAI